eukprot:m.18593 g.18593  ORF g.18593 m.18593 type:complete len:60 (+) comp3684_c0_seq2:151-330(+)
MQESNAGFRAQEQRADSSYAVPELPFAERFCAKAARRLHLGQSPSTRRQHLSCMTFAQT